MHTLTGNDAATLTLNDRQHWSQYRCRAWPWSGWPCRCGRCRYWRRSRRSSPLAAASRGPLRSPGYSSAACQGWRASSSGTPPSPRHTPRRRTVVPLFARWGYFEDTVRLAAALRPALAARGVPERIYVFVLDTPAGSPICPAACRNAAPAGSLTFQAQPEIVRQRLHNPGDRKVCRGRWESFHITRFCAPQRMDAEVPDAAHSGGYARGGSRQRIVTERVSRSAA